MQKYITRTFNVKTGVHLVPNYETKTFDEIQVTLLDVDKVQSNTRIDGECTVKVRMPIGKFFELGEKIPLGFQEALPENKDFLIDE